MAAEISMARILRLIKFCILSSLRPKPEPDSSVIWHLKQNVGERKRQTDKERKCVCRRTKREMGCLTQKEGRHKIKLRRVMGGEDVCCTKCWGEIKLKVERAMKMIGNRQHVSPDRDMTGSNLVKTNHLATGLPSPSPFSLFVMQWFCFLHYWLHFLFPPYFPILMPPHLCLCSLLNSDEEI